MFLESFSTVKSNSLKSLLLTSLSVSFGADGFWTKLRSERASELTVSIGKGLRWPDLLLVFPSTSIFARVASHLFALPYKPLTTELPPPSKPFLLSLNQLQPHMFRMYSTTSAGRPLKDSAFIM